MARGVRKSVQEQLQLLNAQIEKAEAQLKTLYDQQEELERKIREEQAMSIYKLMAENDLSMEELVEMIQSKKSREVA